MYYFFVVDNHGAFIILHIFVMLFFFIFLEKAKCVQGYESVCPLAEAGPGLGLLTQPWMLLPGRLQARPVLGMLEAERWTRRPLGDCQVTSHT